jgi:hypothetical protein
MINYTHPWSRSRRRGTLERLVVLAPFAAGIAARQSRAARFRRMLRYELSRTLREQEEKAHQVRVRRVRRSLVATSMLAAGAGAVALNRSRSAPAA